MADTASAAPSLLPCPFCGHDTPEFERLGTSSQSCIVACGNCGARHESGDEYGASGTAWNRRAQPTPPAVVEPLTDEQIDAIWREKPRYHAAPIGVTDIEFARAIEAAAHGIGIKNGDSNGR